MEVKKRAPTWLFRHWRWRVEPWELEKVNFKGVATAAAITWDKNVREKESYDAMRVCDTR